MEQDAWLDAALAGDGLPEGARAELSLAGHAYPDAAAVKAHLDAANAAAPGHPAVLVATYRFHFYRNELDEALPIAATCIGLAAARLGLPADWRQVHSRSGLAEFDAYLGRFYLLGLKAYGYLLMRLDKLDEGMAVLHKVSELDPEDRVGAAALLQAAVRRDEDE